MTNVGFETVLRNQAPPGPEVARGRAYGKFRYLAKPRATPGLAGSRLASGARQMNFEERKAVATIEWNETKELYLISAPTVLS